MTLADLIDGARNLLARAEIALPDRPNRVAVLRLTGVIGRLGPMRSGLTYAGLERTIDRAFAMRDIRAVALVINSPGGSPAQTALIARCIRQNADEKGIPVFAFVEDLAASGGFWLACAADEIYALDSSIVGSIGVITAGFGFPEALQRLGIERRVHAVGRRKGLLDPFRPEAPEDIARLNSIQIDIHDSFKDFVRTRRGARLKAPEEELFEGDIWTGKQAIALGLIDAIGDMRDVLRRKYGARVVVRMVGQRTGVLRGLMPWSRGPSAPAAAAADLIAVMEDWAFWRRFGL
jgi:signal peptide peptidase SppA